MLGILIMLNNYFHDVASAALLCCAMLMIILLKKAESVKNKSVEAFFIGIYEKTTFLAAISMAWILLGGIVRALAYRAYEWSDAVGRGQVPALIMKHVLFFFLVGLGIHYWLKLRSEVARLRKKGETARNSVE